MEEIKPLPIRSRDLGGVLIVLSAVVGPFYLLHSVL
jgi:hypothetical protein